MREEGREGGIEGVWMLSSLQVGRQRGSMGAVIVAGRQGGSEGGREGGREKGRQGRRKAGRERGSMDAVILAGRQAEREYG